jgi:hypothetical protein
MTGKTETPTGLIVRPVGAAGAVDVIEQVGAALVRSSEVKDVLDVRDWAETMRHFLSQKNAALASLNAAAELKIRAERKLGEMVRDMPKRRAGRPRKGIGSIVEPIPAPPTLADLGIDKKESHRWQTLAAPSQADFEGFLAGAKARGEELSTAAALRFAKGLKSESARSAKAKPRPPQDAPAPIRVAVDWSDLTRGIRCDFERELVAQVTNLARIRVSNRKTALVELAGDLRRFAARLERTANDPTQVPQSRPAETRARPKRPKAAVSNGQPAPPGTTQRSLFRGDPVAQARPAG